MNVVMMVVMRGGKVSFLFSERFERVDRGRRI